MKRAPHCPYCGQEKQFSCRCDYGKIMKIKMEPTEREQGLYHKKYCPKCGKTSTDVQCKHCQYSFSQEDFWYKNSW
ncbi:MAG: hypothetical protein ABUK01_18235 [Leptospirales bacterium]